MRGRFFVRQGNCSFAGLLNFSWFQLLPWLLTQLMCTEHFQSWLKKLPSMYGLSQCWETCSNKSVLPLKLFLFFYPECVSFSCNSWFLSHALPISDGNSKSHSLCCCSFEVLLWNPVINSSHPLGYPRQREFSGISHHVIQPSEKPFALFPPFCRQCLINFLEPQTYPNLNMVL